MSRGHVGEVEDLVDLICLQDLLVDVVAVHLEDERVRVRVQETHSLEEVVLQKGVRPVHVELTQLQDDEADLRTYRAVMYVFL